MLEINESTKKLLEGLDIDSINVGSLAKYIAQSGVFASIHIARCRGSVSLPPRAVGVRVDRMPAEARKAYRNIVQLGNLSFLPKEHENRLNAIESRMRRVLEDCTTTDGFLPAHLYDRFKEELSECKRDFFIERDELVNMWDDVVSGFSADVTAMLAGIRMQQRDRLKLHETIMKSVPSKERFSNSFKVSFSAKAFPGVPATNAQLPAELNDAIERSWAENTIYTAEQAIISLITDAYSSINEAVASYLSTGSIHGRRLTALAKLGKRLGSMNVFCNPLVDDLSTALVSVAGKSADDAEGVLEECVVSIFKYSKEVGVDIRIKNAVWDEETIMSKIAA